MSDTLPRAAALATTARRFADHIAVVDRGGVITYSALFRQAAGLAHRLLDAGVQPGDPVASFVRNGIPAVWASYGIILCGAAELALNTALGEADRRHCLTLAGARHIVVAAADSPLFVGSGLIVHILEKTEPRDLVAADLPRATADGWARIGFTSGTTGLPKGIVTTQWGRWMGNMLQRATMPHKPTPRSRLLLMTPFSHGASLLTSGYLDVGGSVMLLDGVDPPLVLDLIERGEVDEMFAPPTVLAKIVAAAETAADGKALPGLKTIYCGTAVLSPRLYARARAIFGPVIRITYGKTEVVNPITVLEAAETDAWYAEGGPHADACVGWPATGVEVVIDALAGDVGEVKLRGHQMMAGTIRPGGYEPLPPGAFHETGDLGYLDTRGRLHLVGRAADVIKSGGYKVAPEEIERVLSAALGRGEVAAFGIASEYWGEVIVAVAEAPAPGWEEKVQAAMAGMTAYKRPRALLAMDELPRNAMLKVSRKAVRDRVLATHRLADGPRPVLEPIHAHKPGSAATMTAQAHR